MRLGIFLVAVLSLVASPAAFADPLTVSGMVLTAAGNPLPEARVALLAHPSNYEWARKILVSGAVPEPVAMARTDRSGRFLILSPEVGVWTVEVEAVGFVPMRYRPLPIVDFADLPPVTLLSDAGTTIEIRDENGAALSGVWVYALTGSEPVWRGVVADGWQVGARVGRSDRSGHLRLPRAPDERLGITAFASWSPAGQRFEVGERSGLVLRRAPGFGPVLEVCDSNGDPLGGIVVSVGPLAWPAGITGEDGRLGLGGSVSGATQLHLFAEDGRRQDAVLEPRSVGDKAPARMVFLPRSRVTGRLIAAADRQPLAGALLWPAHDPGTFVVTDSRGAYAFMAPPGGHFSVQADAAGFLPDAFWVQKGNGSAHQVPTLALRAAAAMSGSAVDAAGAPLDGVVIEAARLPARNRPRVFPPGRADSRSVSDSGGRFTLSDLPPEGIYELTAVKKGWITSKLTVYGPGSAQARGELRFVLEKARPAHGRVMDGDGRPVAGAEVRLRVVAEPGSQPGDSVAASTDEEGRFELTVPGRRLDVEVRKRSFSPLTLRGVEVPPGRGSFDLGTWTLAAGVAIEGRVTDENDGPVAGVEVRLAEDDERPARWLASRIRREEPVTVTEPEGGFRVEDLKRGARFHLYFHRAGYLPARVVGVKAPSSEPLVVTLEPGAFVDGQVVDEDGAPIAHSRVTLRQKAPPPGTVGVELRRGESITRGVAADARGEFEIEELIPGKFEISASAPGFQPAKPVDVEILTAGSTRGVRLILERGAIVEGRVSSVEEEPIAGARIRVGRTRAISDAEGLFRLDGVSTGPQALVVDHLEFERQIRELKIEPGLNPVDLVLEGGWPIAGRAVQAGGEPVEGARVKLRLDSMGERRHYQTVSGADGSFSFTRVLDGRYDVEAHRRGFGPAELRHGLSVAGGPVEDFEVVLPKAAFVVGRILGLEPEELAAARVEAARGGRSQRGVVDFRGRYEIADLSSGVWLIKAWLSGGSRQVEARVAIDPGVEELEQDLEFGRGFTLTGRVQYDGVPLPETSVSATGYEVAVHRSVSTDHRGGFRFQDLKPGRYRLGLANHRESLIHNEDVDLFEDRDLHIDIATARIRGQVTSSVTSRPVPDALVYVQQFLGYDASRPGSLVTVATDPRGAFTLARLAEGRHRLTVRKDGYAPIERALDLQSGVSMEDLELSLTPTEGLDLVVHLASGPPPPRATLSVLDASSRLILTQTRSLAPDGFTRFATVPPGSWSLVVSAPGGATRELTADVPGPALSVVLQAGARLRVRVPPLVASNLVAHLTLLGSDGRPFRGLGPTGALQSRWILNGGSGTVEGVPPGVWTLEAVASDGQTWRGSVTTAGGQDLDVNLE